MTDRVSQKNVRGKYVSARDINIDIHVDASLIKQLEALAEKLEAEMDSRVLCNSISDDLLEYGYSEQSISSDALEKKLNLAELSGRLDRSLMYKDRFRRALEKHIHFRSAQRIYTILMSAILHKFDAYVVPAINEGAVGDDLYTIVADAVINPLANSMPESALDADHARLWGILYFLTGNCFLWWSSK